MASFAPSQTARRAPATPTLISEPEVRFALAHGAFVVALLLVTALHGSTLMAAVASLATVGLVAAGTRVSLAVFLGVSQWAVITGFLVNSLGQLTFTAADLARLAALGLLTVLATRLGCRLAR